MATQAEVESLKDELNDNFEYYYRYKNPNASLADITDEFEGYWSNIERFYYKGSSGDEILDTILNHSEYTKEEVLFYLVFHIMSTLSGREWAEMAFSHSLSITGPLRVYIINYIAATPPVIFTSKHDVHRILTHCLYLVYLDLGSIPHSILFEDRLLDGLSPEEKNQIIERWNNNRCLDLYYHLILLPRFSYTSFLLDKPSKRDGRFKALGHKNVDLPDSHLMFSYYVVFQLVRFIVAYGNVACTTLGNKINKLHEHLNIWIEKDTARVPGRRGPRTRFEKYSFEAMYITNFHRNKILSIGRAVHSIHIDTSRAPSYVTWEIVDYIMELCGVQAEVPFFLTSNPALENEGKMTFARLCKIYSKIIGDVEEMRIFKYLCLRALIEYND